MLLLLLACPPKKTPDSAGETGEPDDTGAEVGDHWLGTATVDDALTVHRGAAGDKLDRALNTPGGLLLAAPQNAAGLGRVCMDTWDGSCWTGPAVGSYFGTGLAWVDGPVVSAFQDPANGQWAGAVHVLDTDVVLVGEPGDNAGISLAAAGGLLAVGAFGRDTTETDGGVVYLVSDLGQSGELNDGDYVFGGDPGGQFGVAVAWGDLDGDGQSDLLVGASGATGEALGTGAAFTFYGPVPPFARDLDADHAVRGLASQDQTGKTVAAGDHDGDGIDEWAIGSPGVGRVDLLVGTEVIATLNGDEEGRLGFSLVLQDIDGDGKADLVTGATRQGTGGEVLVAYGPLAGELSGQLTVVAEAEGDKLGIGVGATDEGFWVSASKVDENAGAVYLFGATAR